MARFKDPSFNDRAASAAAARQAALEKFKNRPQMDEAAVAARLAAEEARAAREAERRAARVAEKEAAEQAKLDAEREKEDAAKRSLEEEADRLVQQKAARDARYAARKARK